jgi:hypothetical protein
MTRLRRERSPSYLGRSVRQAVCVGYGSLTEVLLETAREPQNPKASKDSAPGSNFRGERTEVSRVHSSSAKDEGTNMNELRRSDEQLNSSKADGQGDG